MKKKLTSTTAFDLVSVSGIIKNEGGDGSIRVWFYQNATWKDGY